MMSLVFYTPCSVALASVRPRTLVPSISSFRHGEGERIQVGMGGYQIRGNWESFEITIYFENLNVNYIIYAN